MAASNRRASGRKHMERGGFGSWSPPHDNRGVKGLDGAAEKPAALSLTRALGRQRARTGRMLTRVRFAGVVTILALVMAVAYGAGQADWRVMVPVVAAYAAGATLLAIVVRISERTAIWAGFGVAILDVP